MGQNCYNIVYFKNYRCEFKLILEIIYDENIHIFFISAILNNEFDNLAFLNVPHSNEFRFLIWNTVKFSDSNSVNDADEEWQEHVLRIRLHSW